MTETSNNKFEVPTTQEVEKMDEAQLKEELLKLGKIYTEIYSDYLENEGEPWPKELNQIAEFRNMIMELIYLKRGYDNSIRFDGSDRESFDRNLTLNISKIHPNEIISYLAYYSSIMDSSEFGEDLYNRIGLTSLLKLPRIIEDFKEMARLSGSHDDYYESLWRMEKASNQIQEKIKNIIDLNDKLVNTPNEKFLDPNYRQYIKLITKKEKVIEIIETYNKYGKGDYLLSHDISPLLIKDLFFNDNLMLSLGGDLSKNLSMLDRSFIEENFEKISQKIIDEGKRFKYAHTNEDLLVLNLYAISIGINNKTLNLTADKLKIKDNLESNLVITSYFGDIKAMEKNFIDGDIENIDGGENANNLRLDFIKNFINEGDFRTKSDKYINDDTIHFLVYNTFKNGNYDSKYGDVIIDILENTDFKAYSYFVDEIGSDNAINLLDLPITDKRFIRIIIKEYPERLENIPKDSLKGKEMLTLFLENYNFNHDPDLYTFKNVLPLFEINDINRIIQVFAFLAKKFPQFSDVTNPDYNQEKTESSFMKMFFIEPEMRNLLTMAYDAYTNKKELEEGNGYDAQQILNGLAKLLTKNGELLNKHIHALKDINTEINKVEKGKDTLKNSIINKLNFFVENNKYITSNILPENWVDNNTYSVELYTNLAVHINKNDNIPPEQKDAVLEKIFKDILKIINEAIEEENRLLASQIKPERVRNKDLLTEIDKDGGRIQILSEERVKTLFLSQIEGKTPEEIEEIKIKFINDNFFNDGADPLQSHEMKILMNILNNCISIKTRTNIIENYSIFKTWIENGSKGDFEEHLRQEKLKEQNQQNNIIQEQVSTNQIENFDEKTSIYTYESTNGKVQLKLEPEEIALAKEGKEKLFTNFYDKLKEVGLESLWDIRKQLFNVISGTDSIGFDSKNGDYLNENEIKTFLNAILKSVGEQEISKAEPLDSFTQKIKDLNNVKADGGTTRNVRGESSIEERFRQRFVPDGNLIGFKRELFENALKGEE